MVRQVPIFPAEDLLLSDESCLNDIVYEYQEFMGREVSECLFGRAEDAVERIPLYNT
jgi:hypothetical protein